MSNSIDDHLIIFNFKIIIQKLGAIQNMNSKVIKKSGPKFQYQFYLKGVDNVFYEERKTQKKLEYYKNKKSKILTTLYILLGTLLLLCLIQPYKGKCPANATCDIFIKCNLAFIYDPKTHECKLPQNFYDNLQQFIGKLIVSTNEQQTKNLCLDKYAKVEKLSVTSIAFTISAMHLIDESVSAKDKLKLAVQGLYNNFMAPLLDSQEKKPDKDKSTFQRIQKFLLDPQNQVKYQFSAKQLDDIYVYPKYRKYTHQTIHCPVIFLYRQGLKQFIQKLSSKQIMITGMELGTIAISIILLLRKIYKNIFTKQNRTTKAKQIYNYLRQLVMKEKIVNVSQAKEEIGRKIGAFDFQTWLMVDRMRAQAKDIGTEEGHFLFWKKLEKVG